MTADGSILNVLCAGAAQGLVRALEARFAAACGARIEARFGAVGAMKEALLGGAACDVMIVTDAMIGALAASGELVGATRAALGRVRTGIAARAGDALPAIGDAQALRTALLGADALYFPDPLRATAGIHFASVLAKLGIDDVLRTRYATFPNGATAMRELAQSKERLPLGCTQITEIRYTPGVQLVGPLPDGFELVTVYAAAITARTARPGLAACFLALLAGEDSRALRVAGGFEFEPPP